MEKINGYVFGSLFNEAEVRQRKYEGERLREETSADVDWYNPIDAPINDKSTLPTALSIFIGDTTEVLMSDVMIGDITNNDPGVAVELGIAYGMNYAHLVFENAIKDLIDLGKDNGLLQKELYNYLDKSGVKRRLIYPVCSDIRVATANQYEGVHIPYGINQYLIGCLESFGSEVKISNDFESALLQLKEDLSEIKK